MGNYLMIRWDQCATPSGPGLHWFAVATDGRLVASGAGDFTDALACYEGFDEAPAVVLLAPGHEILHCEVAIPSGQQRHLKQVLPFLVEEKLVDDIEDVHAAVGPSEKGRPLAVAVVKHVALINWLDKLYSAGLAPSWVVSEALALPWQEGQISVWVGPELGLIRTGKWQAMACDPDNLGVALAGICQRDDGAEGGAPRAQIELLHAADGASIERVEVLQRQLREAAGIGSSASSNSNSNSNSGSGSGDGWLPRVHVRQCAQDLSVLLGQQLATELPASLNLLQGGYATSVQNGQSGGMNWRNIGLGFAACALVYLCFSLGTGAWFNHRAQSTKAEATALYRDWFPEARRVFEPRRQLLSQLNGFSDHGSDRLVRYVDGLSAAWDPAGADLQIVGFAFEAPSDSMRLELRAANIDVLEHFRARLDSAGLSSRLQQVTRHKEGINGRLELGGVM